ncbi:MAG: protein kinase [Nitriliruptor sp.]|uniref:serine/threonine-protein kinase n=1 Tax=Nitriliruptor sp. TaxID=2448056 RepID=UPI0034A0415E
MAPSTDRRVGGRYELTRRIARGGGGTVWAAYDHLLEREVAVKHVEVPGDLPPAERDQLRARVRLEARAAARLLHPSAVTIFDVVDEDGDVHLVLELVEQPTLDALILRDGPLDETMAATVAFGLLDALLAAHEVGIVHRDVKPSNIFVTDDGAVKLTDFGIASVEGHARLTRTGATMGSPQFIAPEQALGHDAAPAADLWGLGASLYFAVEGVPPFERNNAVATVHAVVHEPARPFERADALVPIISRLLEKEPSSRPDAAAIRADLARIADRDALPVPATGPPVVPITTADPGPAPEEDTRPGPAEAADEPDTALTASVALRSSEPRPTSAAPADDPEPRSPRRWLPWAAVLLLVVVVGAVVLNRDTVGDPPPEDGVVAAPQEDGGSTDPQATDGAPDPGDDGEAEAEGDGEPEEGGDGGDPETSAATDVPEAEVPDDWQVVDGPAYRVAIPAGWEVAQGQGRIVDHRDPASSTYLRVDWTPDPRPDPYENWQELSADLADRFDDYQELQLTVVTFRGQPAALLEYTYTAGGAELRAYNLNIFAGERAYALNLQSQADDWGDVAPMFASMVGGFQPE